MAERVPGTFTEGSCIVPTGSLILAYDFTSADIPSYVLVAVWEVGTMDYKPASSGTDTNFTWTKDGVAISGGTYPNATGTLVIIPATSAESGLYKCVFNGRCGTASIEYNLVIP